MESSEGHGAVPEDASMATEDGLSTDNAKTSNDGAAKASVEKTDEHEHAELAQDGQSSLLLKETAPVYGKGGKLIKEPRDVGKAHAKYDTSLYQQYDPVKHSQLIKDIAVAKYTRSHKVFDEYLLYSDPTTTTEDMHDKIPKRGVRLDDLAMALVLKNVTSPKELNQWWPAEFDTKGMPRATRIPLGHAAKMWVSAGDVDIDGNVATAKDEGWYYKWWKGLQVLMGKEGYDAWLYKIRPSWEKDKCGQFGFKLTHKAIFQHESGYTSACEKSGKTDGNPKGNARTNNSGPNKAAKRKVYSAGAGQRKRQKTTVQGVVRHNGRTPSFPRGTSTAVILHFYFGPFEHWY